MNLRPKFLLRIAGFLVFFVAIAHTIDYFIEKETVHMGEQIVLRDTGHHKLVQYILSNRTLDNFYEGLNLDFSITLVIFAALLWLIGNSANKYSVFCTTLLWPVLICIIGFAIIGFVYFYYYLAACNLLAGLFIIAAIFQLRKLSPINSVYEESNGHRRHIF